MKRLRISMKKLEVMHLSTEQRRLAMLKLCLPTARPTMNKSVLILRRSAVEVASMGEANTISKGRTLKVDVTQIELMKRDLIGEEGLQEGAIDKTIRIGRGMIGTLKSQRETLRKLMRLTLLRVMRFTTGLQLEKAEAENEGATEAVASEDLTKSILRAEAEAEATEAATRIGQDTMKMTTIAKIGKLGIGRVTMMRKKRRRLKRRNGLRTKTNQKRSQRGRRKLILTEMRRSTSEAKIRRGSLTKSSEGESTRMKPGKRRWNQSVPLMRSLRPSKRKRRRTWLRRKLVSMTMSTPRLMWKRWRSQRKRCSRLARR